MLQPGQLREGERQEAPLKGPFAGILSEIPDHLIEQFSGFIDAQNISFRKAQAMVRQSYTVLTAMPNPQEAILGIFDFFRNDGARIQTVVTPTRLLQWNGASQTWTVINGVLSGTATQDFTATTVGQKLCFCQGVDKVKIWDGNAANFTDAAAAAVPAKYLAEVDNHLLVGFTVEAGNALPQRVRWTGAGDATDWVSFNAGQTDLFNDLGPITGIVNLYQNGWIFQQWGIVQAQPTGIGTTPFAFRKVVTGKQKGNICPYALTVFNEQFAPYIGKDNVYVWNGSTSEPIGDFPISGNRVRLGARARIFADLKQVVLNQVFGYATTSIGGNPFNAYWIFMPQLNAAWVFNFDEANWTKFVFDSSILTAGSFTNAGSLRIQDLIGLISQQTWTPATLQATNPLDDFLFGSATGSAELSNFSTRSEMPWSLTGFLAFDDLRHEKSTTAVRLLIRDNAAGMVFTVTLSNEKTEAAQSKTVTVGSGTGKMLEIIVTFPQVTGMFLTILINGAAGVPLDISEITPLYVVGNEYRNTF